jgi:DNA-binding transcriptional LysR family regulator
VTSTPTTNIPTELLRTLITVVDLRRFTKAAHAPSVTQPAVSAQIKRLQFLLDIDLFDKSAPGVSLTEKGDLVVNYARRILNINDQILNVLRERLDCEMLEGLADAMADALGARPSDTASSRPEFGARWEAPADDGASRG